MTTKPADAGLSSRLKVNPEWSIVIVDHLICAWIF